jgi:hypothetical protein
MPPKTSMMSVVKYCQLHDTNYTNWCAKCIKDSYDATWQAAAIEIQTFMGNPYVGMYPIKSLMAAVFELPAVEAFFAQIDAEDKFELGLRRMRVRDYAATIVKDWLSNPNNDGAK